MQCKCGEEIPEGRVKLGYQTCLECGDSEAYERRQSWTVVPLHKSAYQLLPNADELKGLNKNG